VHLPLSPFCNIFCRFCARGISRDLVRPGNALRVISPGEALDVFETAKRLCPEISVVGVAGPGDPLASPEALDALYEIKSRYPEIICCLSTNGLNLEKNMEGLLNSGVQALTVTVNALDPEILNKINKGVLIDGRFYTGIPSQKILIDAQERGIRKAHSHSIIIKINIVMIPGINDEHIPHVARKIKEWGASILNIIPIIPTHELKDIKAPSTQEFNALCQKVQEIIPIKMNCRRCRADACGIPGLTDFSKEIYGELNFTETFSHG
jgi:nitrogen fixation protein NifB